MTQAEALEIAMGLHETPMEDLNPGVLQIHAQLQNLSLEMQSLKQEKATQPEACKEVWCIKCKGRGYDKDHYPVFANYIALGGPMPLLPEAITRPSAGPMLWCAICQVAGKHMTDNFNFLHKFVQTPQ